MPCPVITPRRDAFLRVPKILASLVRATSNFRQNMSFSLEWRWGKGSVCKSTINSETMSRYD